MSNLTIRMDKKEKSALMAWAAMRGTTATDYIKRLIAADMESGQPEERARAWFKENQTALSTEAACLEDSGVPGAHLALNYPRPDENV